MKFHNLLKTALLVLLMTMISTASAPAGIASPDNTKAGGGNIVQSGESINLNIGTLPAGKSVTITFEVTVDGPPLTGVTQVCNQGTVSGGNFSSVLTDDPSVGGTDDPTCTPLSAGDVGVIAINSPNSGTGLTATETVTVTIMNFTSIAQSGFDVRFQVTGPINTGPVTETFTGTLPGSGTAMFTFTSTANLSALGSYTITATTLLAGDGNTGNDEDSKNVEHTLVPSPVVDAGNADEGCLGDTFELDGSATSGSGSYDFLWSVQSGPNTDNAQFSDTDVEDPDFTPTLAGSYVLLFTVDDGVAPPVSDDVTITVNPLPTVTFNPFGPFDVSDPPFDMSSAVSPSGGTFSGPGVSGTMFDPGAAGAGMHTINYSFTDGNSCANSASQQVTVNGPSTPPGLVFVVDHFINLYRHGPSEGDIHSNRDIQFKTGKPSTLTGNLTAVDDIVIYAKNKIFGNATAGDDITIKPGAMVTGTVMENASVAEIPLPNPWFGAGGVSRIVPQNGSLTLPPGSYTTVLIRKNATLHLSNDGASGDYYFYILDTEQKSKLSIDVTNGPVNINVVIRLDFEKEAKVLISSGDNGSSDVTFTTLQILPLIIGEKARVLGEIIADNAKVSLEKNSRFKGRLWAREAEVKQGAIFLPHGSSTTLPSITDEPDIEGGDEEEQAPEIVATVTDYELSQSYPNPFNPSTKIGFALPGAGDVTLKIYTITGQLVRTLANGNFSGGAHELVWDAKDDRGAQVATGVYFYQLVAHRQNGEAPFTQTRRMILMK